MQRRFAYALTAGVLSSGAPAGLLGIRLAKRAAPYVSMKQMRRELAADRSAYVYVGGATALIFALFGYILGRQADGLAQLSETDSLTQLFNPRGFSARLRLEFKRSKRYGQPLTLLFLDLDTLKDINDRYGHRVGDEVLRQIAGVIRSELRETDVGARWGGDEFTILAPNTTETAAVRLAERIRSRITELEAPRIVTASIGVATVNPANESLTDSSQLVRAADWAMYQAKRNGKNAVYAAVSAGVPLAEVETLELETF
jgi:diguanylate cyclase (GGDEF)-like protein